VLAILLCESAETVFKMISLILVLFLGATVALAEIHVQNDPHHKAPHPILVSLNSLLYIHMFRPQLAAILRKIVLLKV